MLKPILARSTGHCVKLMEKCAALNVKMCRIEIGNASSSIKNGILEYGSFLLAYMQTKYNAVRI